MAALLLLPTACGQTGALYLPGEPPPGTSAPGPGPEAPADEALPGSPATEAPEPIN
jgi:hypothetical protein